MQLGLDLLPSDVRYQDSGWSFGYPGGSPGRLGTTITSLIRHVDQVSYASLPTRWIEDAGGHSNPHHLNIQVDDIRRRIVPA